MVIEGVAAEAEDMTSVTSNAAPRPVTGLYVLKPWYTRRLQRIIDVAVTRHVSPDAFTAAGVVAAGLAGGALVLSTQWRPAAYAVPVLLALRLAGANLDGAVARARAVSRPVGALLNEIGDRLSDLLILGCIALVTPQSLALLALIAATLPTFVSLAVATAGGSRANGGPVGKTERCLLVSVGALFPSFWPLVLVAIVVGSVVTAGMRLRAGLAELAR